jgi:hypothetical protein
VLVREGNVCGFQQPMVGQSSAVVAFAARGPLADLPDTPANQFRFTLHTLLANTSYGQDCLIRPRLLARKNEFHASIQRDSTGPVLAAEIFRFAPDPNHLHISRHPVPPEGRTRRHERRSGMRWTLWCLKDERCESGRRSRVVLMPRRWHQVGDDASRIVACDGDKKARSPGRTRSKPLKPFACGNAG